MNDASRLPNVAIVGRPNVGKSALFNRLIGRKIAIVHDQPGITRDRISAICTHGDRPFALWDTGGVLGAGESELTAMVRAAVEQAINDGDLLLLVVDGKEGLSPLDHELARILRKEHKPVVLVINKIDSEKREDLAAEFTTLGFSPSHPVSAEHNRGIFALLETIVQFLPSPVGLEKVDDAAPKTKPPLAIGIVGRPNVGKSSLINSIVRNERAMVSELPGTTRDAVDISYERNGRRFVLIDTAGIRRRSKRSSSVEVFSVMRAERSIRRADVCVLVIDITAGVTAQDKRIAGSIHSERKAVIVVLNKWDLIKSNRNQRCVISRLVDETRARIFVLEYAPVLIASALSGEHVDKLFLLIDKIHRAARRRIGTGSLNRLLRQAFDSNPPPVVKGRRLKLYYAAQAGGKSDWRPHPPEFVFFVNDPRLLQDTYRRYLESQIRSFEPYPGLPIVMTFRARKASSHKPS